MGSKRARKRRGPGGVRRKRSDAAPARPDRIACPPTGNTGGKLTSVQFDERTIGVHWLRVIHPAASLDWIRTKLVREFGEPDEVRGRWFYERGERFGNGTLLLWGSTVNGSDESEGTVCIDVPGSAIDAMDPLERFEVLRSLSLGGRVSRIDLAADAFHSRRVGLIDSVIDSCGRGELCGARSWSPRLSYTGQEVDGYGVTIGKRGNHGSGRYVRVYDKGLESGEKPRGQWERFEVEFSGDCAAEVGIDLFGEDDGRWDKRAWDRLNGALSFRKNTGDQHLVRREFVAWWSSWTSGTRPTATVHKRAERNLDRFRRWLSETVLPTVARLSLETGEGLGATVERLVGDAVHARGSDKYMRVMLAEWFQLIRPRPWLAA